MIQLLQNFAAGCSSPGFFGIPTWYKYLDVSKSSITKECEVKFDLMSGGKFNGDGIILIGLGIVDILIHIVALLAVFFVIYGGIKYITSSGSPENTKGAKDTIVNALLGLAIAIVAAAVVSFIGNTLK
jgi:hypothetical protein